MMVGIEDVGNATAGSETGDITEEEVVDFLEGGWVLDFVFLTDITKNEGVVDISDVAVFFGEVIVDVRTSKTTVHEVLVESGVGIVKCIIFNKFAEGERENLNHLPRPAYSVFFSEPSVLTIGILATRNAALSTSASPLAASSLLSLPSRSTAFLAASPS